MKHPKIEVYKSKKNGQFSWRMIAANGKKIACAGETYHNKRDCIKSLKKVADILLGYNFTDTTQKVK